MATQRSLQKNAIVVIHAFQEKQNAIVVIHAFQEKQNARDVAYADSMIQQNAHVVKSATPVRKVVKSALNAMSMMNVLANFEQ